MAARSPNDWRYSGIEYGSAQVLLMQYFTVTLTAVTEVFEDYHMVLTHARIRFVMKRHVSNFIRNFFMAMRDVDKSCLIRSQRRLTI